MDSHLNLAARRIAADCYHATSAVEFAQAVVAFLPLSEPEADREYVLTRAVQWRETWKANGIDNPVAVVEDADQELIELSFNTEKPTNES